MLAGTVPKQDKRMWPHLTAYWWNCQHCCSVATAALSCGSFCTAERTQSTPCAFCHDTSSNSTSATSASMYECRYSTDDSINAYVMLSPYSLRTAVARSTDERFRQGRRSTEK